MRPGEAVDTDTLRQVASRRTWVSCTVVTAGCPASHDRMRASCRHGAVKPDPLSRTCKHLPMPSSVALRHATLDDALVLSALATQVFLDTYATSGVSADLAKEVAALYSTVAFEKRLQNKGAEIVLAGLGQFVLGFADLDSTTHCPAPGVHGLEVLRLYVQAPFQRHGIGKALMSFAERRALERGVQHLWLTAWSGNTPALSFYPAMGFRDVGATQYFIEGKAYENRVFVKRASRSVA